MIILIFSLIAWAQAEFCDVRTVSQTPVSDRSFMLQLPNDLDVLVIGTSEITNEDRRAISQLFWNSAREDEAAILEKANVYLSRYKETLRQIEQDLDFLKQRMELDPEYFVAIEASETALKRWQAAANELYLQEFVLSNRRSDEIAAVWKKLSLLASGAPLYLRASQPGLFGEDELTAIDVQAAKIKGASSGQADESQKEVAASINTGLELRAKRATEKMLESLADNSKSLRAFKRFAALVKPGSSFLRGKSDEEIRQYILKRTWRRVRGDTRKWLDAQLAYIREKERPVPKPEEKEEPKSATTVDVSANALFEQIMKPGNRGAFFVNQAHLYSFSKVLRQGCLLSLSR